MREVRALRWQQTLDELLAALAAKAKLDEAKSASWKVAVATRMKQTTDVANAWLADKLGMGSGFYVSKHAGRLRKEPDHPARQHLPKLEKVKGTA